MKQQKASKFGIKDLQAVVDESLNAQGLVEAKSIPAISWSGGKVRVWALDAGAGQLVVRREIYSHNGPRLQLDLGLLVQGLQASINSLVDGLGPWNAQAKGAWYSYCSFGWSLGQTHSKLLPYALRNELPPQEVVFEVVADQSEIGREPICFEAQGKALWFPDQPAEAEARVHQAVDCLVRTGFPAFHRYLADGLQKDFFDNPLRVDTSIPLLVVEAVHEFLIGNVDQAVALLKSKQLSSEPEWKSNCSLLIDQMLSRGKRR